MLCLRNNYFSLKFHQLLVSKSKFFLLLPQYNFNQHLFSILRNNKIYFFFTHSRFVISTKLGFLKGSYCWISLDLFAKAKISFINKFLYSTLNLHNSIIFFNNFFLFSNIEYLCTLYSSINIYSWIINLLIYYLICLQFILIFNLRFSIHYILKI